MVTATDGKGCRCSWENLLKTFLEQWTVIR